MSEILSVPCAPITVRSNKGARELKKRRDADDPVTELLLDLMFWKIRGASEGVERMPTEQADAEPVPLTEGRGSGYQDALLEQTASDPELEPLRHSEQRHPDETPPAESEESPAIDDAVPRTTQPAHRMSLPLLDGPCVNAALASSSSASSAAHSISIAAMTAAAQHSTFPETVLPSTDPPVPQGPGELLLIYISISFTIDLHM